MNNDYIFLMIALINSQLGIENFSRNVAQEKKQKETHDLLLEIKAELTELKGMIYESAK